LHYATLNRVAAKAGALYIRCPIEDDQVMRSILCAAVAALIAASAAFALAPPDVRIVAGSMPGFPHATPQRLPSHALTAAQRQRFTQRFARIRIGDAAAAAVLRMGRVHKVVHYTVGGNACDYFDGGFVLCITQPRVAAKGYEVTG
jgi:hypothetical protein